MRKTLFVLAVLAVLAVVIAGIALLRPAGEPYEAEVTDYKTPAPKDDEALVDDKIGDKKPAFDAALVDRRPLGDGAWLLNASAAVLRLDVPIVKPDQEPELLQLHPSYAAAAKGRGYGPAILPSVNLLDGKAKQFDDGLYAAIDLAYYQGVKDKLQSHVQLVRRIADKAGKSSAAAPHLAAGLELAGVKLDVADSAEKDRLLAEFHANGAASKPIGFYTWSEQLGALFRFMRFFQRPFGEANAKELEIPQALAAVLASDKALLADYRQAIAFYAKLSNPNHSLSLADVPQRQTSGHARHQTSGAGETRSASRGRRFSAEHLEGNGPLRQAVPAGCAAERGPDEGTGQADPVRRGGSQAEGRQRLV